MCLVMAQTVSIRHLQILVDIQYLFDITSSTNQSIFSQSNGCKLLNANLYSVYCNIIL